MLERPWGFGTYALPLTAKTENWLVSDIDRIAQQRGIERVQICENVPWDELGSETTPTTIEFSERVQFEIGTRGIGEHLHRAFFLCKVVGSPFLRLVIDSEGHEPSVNEAIELLKPFTEYGVQLGIENHDRFCSEQLLELIEPLGAGIVLDTANSLGTLEGPRETLRLLGPKAICLHWKPVKAIRKPNQLGFDIVGCPSRETPLELAEWLRGTGNASVMLEQWAPDAEHELAWFDDGLKHIQDELARLKAQ